MTEARDAKGHVILIACLMFFMAISTAPALCPAANNSGPTPPYVVSTNPANHSTDVQLNTDILITPKANLDHDKTYICTVLKGTKDLAGNAMVDVHTFMFSTEKDADTTPPTIISTDPANGSKDININSNLTITFSEPMNTSFTEGSITLVPDVQNITANWDVTNTTLILSGKLEEGKSYTVAISTEARDKAGNKMTAPYSFEFRTKSGVGQPSGPTTPGPNWGDLTFLLPIIIIIIVAVIVLVAMVFVLKKRKNRPVDTTPPPQLTFKKKEDRPAPTPKPSVPETKPPLMPPPSS